VRRPLKDPQILKKGGTHLKTNGLAWIIQGWGRPKSARNRWENDLREIWGLPCRKKVGSGEEAQGVQEKGLGTREFLGKENRKRTKR